MAQGNQAYSTFVGLTELREIESAKVFSPTKAHREAFARKMTEVTGVPVEPVEDAPRAAQDVDIVLCMTNTNVPVIDGSWLEPGQYIISVIGSNIELVKSGNLDKPRRGDRRRHSQTVRFHRRPVSGAGGGFPAGRHLLAGPGRRHYLG